MLLLTGARARQLEARHGARCCNSACCALDATARAATAGAASTAPGAPGRRKRFADSAAQPQAPPAANTAPLVVTERGVAVDVRGAFFRSQTAHARDLAVLAALLLRRSSSNGELRVLDVMTGAGIRAARYLLHAGATSVHANDLDGASRAAANLEAALAAAAAAGMPRRGAWSFTREESCRLLMRLALEGQTFHVVDVDGFGSRGVPAGLALGIVAFGGVLVLNSTDWALGAQHAGDGASLAAAYGAHVHPCPAAPEQGLRVLLGGVAREAAQRGLRIEPLLSYYAPGPAWRVMVRVYRGAAARCTAQLGFNAHCKQCGAGWHLRWRDLGGSLCTCGAAPTLSGPLWHGPLHDAEALRGVTALAEELGWLESPPYEPGTLPPAQRLPRLALRKLLALLQQEADDALPPLYVRLEDVARFGKTATPPRDKLIEALRARGHAAAQTHCDERALKTSAPWGDVLAAARDA